MLTLLYHTTSAPARAARMLLHEKSIEHTLRMESYWERHPELAALSPECSLPILLIDEGTHIISGPDAVLSYIEESSKEPRFFGETLYETAKIRQLLSWFLHKFSYEVGNYIVGERLIRYYNREGPPRSEIIRAASMNLRTHLEYITFLLQNSRLLAGDQITIVDIVAAAQLSVIDYLGDVPWKEFPQAKEWYLLLKSRPSFKPILREIFAGFQASAQYAALDF